MTSTRNSRTYTVAPPLLVRERGGGGKGRERGGRGGEGKGGMGEGGKS